MARYAAEYCPAVAVSRYLPAGSPVNSNAPCASVVTVRGRTTNPLPICTGTPLFIVIVIVVVTVVVVPAGVPGGGGGGGGGMAGNSMTLARRMGDPVSAATTRPRMMPVPVGSG